MATILRESTGEEIQLGAWHTIGRSRSCDLCLDAREVSKQHALIAWNGIQWTLRDLHSKNGTWFNDASLSPGRDIPLKPNASFAFGSQADRWRVVDLKAPVARAVSLVDQTERVADNNLIPLPSQDEPEVVLFKSKNGTWTVEWPDGQREPIQDHQTITVGEVPWVVHLPEPVDETWQGSSQPTPASISVRFRVSQDQESLQVSFLHNNVETILSPRVHLQVLYVLAQARLKDQDNPSLPEKEHGWLYRDQLANSLKIYDNRLYVYVYRAREQFAKEGVLDATEIIERRSDTHQVRLGVSRIEIL